MESGNDIREKFKPGMQVVYAGAAYEIAEGHVVMAFTLQFRIGPKVAEYLL